MHAYTILYNHIHAYTCVILFDIIYLILFAAICADFCSQVTYFLVILGYFWFMPLRVFLFVVLLSTLHSL